MNLTKWAFEHKQFTLMTIGLLVLVGIGVYQVMPRSEDPGYIVRAAQVTTAMPGGSPERMELLVSDKLEKEIQQMPEIDYIKSESKTGISVITVNILESYKNMRPIWDKLRRKVEDGTRKLPNTAHKPVVNDEYGDVFGIVLGIVWDGFTFAKMRNMADDIRDELLRIPDVAKVEIWGIQDERVFIDYNNAQLAELGFSPDQLAMILEKRNIINSGGVIESEKERIAVEPTGNFTSVESIKNTLIEIPNSNKIIPLQDIADVYRGYVYPPSQIMRTDGQRSLGLAISMREGGNILELGEHVLKMVERLKTTYPVGIEFQIINFQPTAVKTIIDDFMVNLFQAVVIVCTILLVFLGLRTGLVVASLIPVVICITFLIMSFLNIGLDQVSLAALMISLGLLVDNSIVVSESILVMMHQGVKPVDAAIQSTKELRGPLLISSLITSSAFLPIFLAESGTGEYTSSIFKVVTITLLTSWVVAQTLVPILCVYFLKVEKKKEDKNAGYQTSFYRVYRAVLVTLLRNKVLTLGTVFSLFILALFGFTQLPNIFFPPSDNPAFTAEIDLPVGSSIENTESVIIAMDQFIEENFRVNEERKEGVLSWATYVGSGGPRYRLQHDPEPPNPYYTYTYFNTTDRAIVDALIEDLDAFFFNQFPDVRTKIRPLEMGTPVKYPVEVRLSGKDLPSLYTIADQVKEKLQSLEGSRQIGDDWGQKAKKVVIDIDDAMAERAGMTNEDVARSLESAFSGIPLTQYREEDQLIPTVLRSVVAEDTDLIASETFSVYSQKTGQSVPLDQIANIHLVWEPSQIFRRDRLKTITVQSLLAPGYTATDINNELRPWLDEISQQWPLGFFWEFGGEYFTSTRASDSIEAKLPIAAVLILILLMLQFNSLRRTLIILCTVPMAMIGVVTGLLINDSYMGFMTLLGMISLAGMVIVNGVVLLDRIKLDIIQNKLEPSHAVIESSQKRLRPILLTALTTICGLLPLWLGGASMWKPMAISIIFGLLGATLLTLGVVPVLYATFFHLNYRKYRYEAE